MTRVGSQDHKKNHKRLEDDNSVEENFLLGIFITSAVNYQHPTVTVFDLGFFL
jgi:hypothetical protein